ncbi:ArnT family glycosyltransferase [Gilvibacter sp.]|uniref:ArnT family glycosyltransferase n=1 Tax=Gilvibacter sp. TaxID=2729997 RepID=UPI003F49C75F
MQWLKDRPLTLLLLSCIPLFLIHLGELAVNIMEARNFITAREMLVDDNWLLTTINGEPRYQKPPLPTWLTAFSGAVFGLKVWALRLPAVLSAVLLMVFGFKLHGELLSNRRQHFWGALVLITSFYIIFAGRNGQWDIFTHAFMMVAIYAIHKLFSQTKKLLFYGLLAGLALAASWMSKGPVSLYALLLPFLIAYGIVYKYRWHKGLVLPLLLMLVVAIVGSGWWFWYTYTYDGETLRAITEREANNWTSYNVRPFYYYWSFFTQSGLWTLPAFVALLYPYLKKRVSDPKGYLFSLLWTLLSVVLLSIIPEKKSRYLLPVLIPMAWNTSFYLEYLIEKFKELTDWKEKVGPYLHFGILGTVGLLFPLGGYYLLQDHLNGYWVWFVLLSLSLVVIGFFIWRSLIRKQIQKALVFSVALVMAVICFGLPLAETLSYNPKYQALSSLHQLEEQEELPVFEYDFFTPELIWDYQGIIPVIKNQGEFFWPEQDAFGVLVAEDHLEEFLEDFKDFNYAPAGFYDMNPQAKGESGYKTRLARMLFKVSKRK